MATIRERVVETLGFSLDWCECERALRDCVVRPREQRKERLANWPSKSLLLSEDTSIAQQAASVGCGALRTHHSLWKVADECSSAIYVQCKLLCPRVTCGHAIEVRLITAIACFLEPWRHTLRVRRRVWRARRVSILRCASRHTTQGQSSSLYARRIGNSFCSCGRLSCSHSEPTLGVTFSLPVLAQLPMCAAG